MGSSSWWPLISSWWRAMWVMAPDSSGRPSATFMPRGSSRRWSSSPWSVAKFWSTKAMSGTPQLTIVSTSTVVAPTVRRPDRTIGLPTRSLSWGAVRSGELGVAERDAATLGTEGSNVGAASGWAESCLGAFWAVLLSPPDGWQRGQVARRWPCAPQ